MRKYDNFCKALENLKECSKIDEPYSVIEKTGMIGLFSICFEASWKLMKEMLEYHGRFEQKTGSPRMIIKIAYECGMINNEEIWIEILDTRNSLAHTYDEESVIKTISRLKSSYISVFEKLKQEIDKNWL